MALKSDNFKNKIFWRILLNVIQGVKVLASGDDDSSKMKMYQIISCIHMASSDQSVIYAISEPTVWCGQNHTRVAFLILFNIFLAGTCPVLGSLVFLMTSPLGFKAGVGSALFALWQICMLLVEPSISVTR